MNKSFEGRVDSCGREGASPTITMTLRHASGRRCRGPGEAAGAKTGLGDARTGNAIAAASVNLEMPRQISRHAGPDGTFRQRGGSREESWIRSCQLYRAFPVSATIDTDIHGTAKLSTFLVRVLGL
jgi:hypothetical protein